MPLTQFSEIVSASASPLQSSKASNVSSLAPDNENVSPDGFESKDVSASTSPKEEPTEQFTEPPVKRRKRHKRKNTHNQEPCLMRGVYFKNMKWQAAIKVDKKQIHLGTVGSQVEAAHLYDRAAFMCGREPNFELSEEEKKELRKFNWEEFLAITRSSITCKKHKRRSILESEKESNQPLSFNNGEERIDSSEDGQ